MQLNEPQDHDHASTSLKTVLLIFAIVVIGALGYLVYAQYNETDTTDYSAPSVKDETISTEDDAKVTTDETTDWKTFTSTTQGGSISFVHPSDYIVSENADGFITIKDSGGILVADVTAATGSVPSNTAFVANTTNDWFSVVASQEDLRTTSELSGRKISGIFGAKAGSFNSAPDGTMSGKSGSTYIFSGTSVIVVDLYDNGDTALRKKLGELIDSLSQK